MLPPSFLPPPSSPGGCHSTVYEELMGWLGCAAAWVLFLVPIEVMLKIRRRGAIEDFSATPYMVSALQCGMWTVYAIVTPCKIQPLVTNGVGVALELAYIIFFLYYAAAARTKVALNFGGYLLFFAVLTVLGVVIAPHLPITGFPVQDPPLSKETTILGFVCAGLNICMYAAPLSIMRTVVRTKSVEYMPLPLTVAVGICSCFWLTYALSSDPVDDFILVPNAAGVLLCIAQVILYSIYCGGDQRRNSKTEPLHTDDPGSVLISPVSALDDVQADGTEPRS